MKSNSKPEKLIYIALMSALINGILVYSLSLQLSSNQYFSTTQFATLFTTCIMFTGHGLGGIIFSKLVQQAREKHVYRLLKIWIGVIICVFWLVFQVFPLLMVEIQQMILLNRSLSIIPVGEWTKIVVAGVVQLPAFLIEGMLYSALFGLMRVKSPKSIPWMSGWSTLGSAAGYLLGLFLPIFPGINATFLLAIIMLITVILTENIAVNFVVMLSSMTLLSGLNVDSAFEKLRIAENQVYAQEIDGKVVDYAWSRFQKSEYIESGDGNNLKMSLVLNGAFQVMASKDKNTILNVGYESIYQPEFVKDKKILIIGSGMGRGVQIAKENGAERIDAIDIEPSLASKYDIYKEYVQDVYNAEGVNFHVMDGRVALRSFEDVKYDLIVFEGVINQAAVYSLNVTTEGYIHTAEAMKAAINLLEPDGIFVNYTITAEKTGESFIKQYPETADGYTMKYIYALADDTNSKLKYYVSLIGASKDTSKLSQLATSVLQPKDNVTISNYFEHNVDTPSTWSITDDRPFPYVNSENEIRFELYLAVVFAFGAVIICIYGFKKRQASVHHFQFSVLGALMMMVELFIISKLKFFLGDSMLGYTIGSTVFLVAFAVGNTKSLSLSLTIKKFSSYFLLAIALFCTVFVFSSPEMLIPYTGAGYTVLRILLCIICISPMAFLCGTFFPKMVLLYVDESSTQESMAMAMILDSFGVCSGFFLFNYISTVWGYTYALPIIILGYIGLNYLIESKRSIRS